MVYIEKNFKLVIFMSALMLTHNEKIIAVLSRFNYTRAPDIQLKPLKKTHSPRLSQYVNDVT
jgi:hypothetical protein